MNRIAAATITFALAAPGALAFAPYASNNEYAVLSSTDQAQVTRLTRRTLADNVEVDQFSVNRLKNRGARVFSTLSPTERSVEERTSLSAFDNQSRARLLRSRLDRNQDVKRPINPTLHRGSERFQNVEASREKSVNLRVTKRTLMKLFKNKPASIRSGTEQSTSLEN